MFSRIYRDGAWGRGGGEFYSGDGSHDPRLVGPYVDAVRAFLSGLPRPVHIVDIGCGDFNVGRQLLDLADAYVGCDIVPELIERNRTTFESDHLRFQVRDAAHDPLPEGNVVLVRQVFQHLSNRDVGAIVAKLAAYRYWIVTEHLPPDAGFPPNVDKLPGRDIRLDTARSGVVVTAPPFNARPRHEQMLCEVPSYLGVIRTTAYSFA